MGLESEVETFHLRTEAEGAGRSLTCFFLILLPSYHSDLSRLQLLSVWKSNEPPPLRVGRHSECPAAASAKACSPRTGTRVLPRSTADADAAGDSRRRSAAAWPVQKSSYSRAAATPTGRRQSTAARQSASRETGHHARRQRCRGLALVGDVWRQAIRGTRAALESISCVRSGNDRR